MYAMAFFSLILAIEGVILIFIVYSKATHENVGCVERIGIFFLAIILSLPFLFLFPDEKFKENGGAEIVSTIIGIFGAISFGLLAFISHKKNREIQRIKGEIPSKLDERTKKEIAEFEDKLNLFLKDESYKIIRMFAKKYFEYNYTDEDLDKLRQLIITKGYDFSSSQLETIIYKEKMKQRYNEFQRLILSMRPTKLEDYINSYIEFEGFSPKKIGLLVQILKENGISIKASELLSKIKELKSKAELEYFEKNLLESEEPLTIYDLDLISGFEFENFLKQLFERMNYSVIQTSLSSDQGADLIISKLGGKTIVQAKRYANKVSNKAIQEVVAAIKHYNADKGMVVTPSTFTRSAVELANSNNIELIDRDLLTSLLGQYF